MAEAAVGMTDDAAIDAARQLFAPALGHVRRGGRMAGRRVLVVGAGQRRTGDVAPPVGNGRAIALLCAREGAAVCCADLDRDSAGETARLIAAEGGRASAWQVDAAQADTIVPMIDAACAALGGLDGLVVNVGIANRNRFGHETADAWDAVQAVNLRAHMLCAQAAAARMAPGASIVFVSSTAVAFAGQPQARRANVIAPGLIDTPMGRDASRARPARAARPLPFGRQGTAWEVAHATVFLLSADASYVNGQVLIADGGLSIGAVRSDA
jgi:NAD(P)-dependent dehydrogenase (short-subunit alcohol dehydrogenase family)